MLAAHHPLVIRCQSAVWAGQVHGNPLPREKSTRRTSKGLERDQPSPIASTRQETRVTHRGVDTKERSLAPARGSRAGHTCGWGSETPTRCPDRRTLARSGRARAQSRRCRGWVLPVLRFDQGGSNATRKLCGVWRTDGLSAPRRR